MVPRFLPCLVALASGLFVSCYPYPEDQTTSVAPPATPTPATPTPATPTPAAPTAPLNRPAPAPDLTSINVLPPPVKIQSASPALSQHPSARPATSEKLLAPPPPDLPVANKAAGKEGYVLSPYSNKLILVRGVPSGTVVPDPASPPSARKYFRVP
ncbi:MAG: hypothetical protein WCO57_08885 [Verrucomicrobiota bacterium]